MIKSIARRWLANFSQRYHYDTTYMVHLLEQRLSVFLKFATLNLLSSQRRGIPATPWWTARIRAALWEDCGSCVQLVCNMAIADGIDPDTVTAVVSSNISALDEDCVLALQFTESVLAHDPVADSLREQARLHWSEDGLISLAMTISATRVYPCIKSVLGHRHSCSCIEVAQQAVTPAFFDSATMERNTSARYPR